MIVLLTTLASLAVAIIGAIMWYLKNYHSLPARIAKLEKERDEKNKQYIDAIRRRDTVQYSLLTERNRLSTEIGSLRQQQRKSILSRF